MLTHKQEFEMGKILGSVAFLIAIIVGGYYFDPVFHAHYYFSTHCNGSYYQLFCGVQKSDLRTISRSEVPELFMVMGYRGI